MNMPIFDLKHNISADFERVVKANSKSFLAKISSGVVNPEIDWIVDRGLARGPWADPVHRKLCLQETHLAYLWAFFYSNFIVFEERVQKPLLARTFRGEIVFDTVLLMRARDLGLWADTLPKSYSTWDEKALPNPRTVSTEEERFYVPKVNNLFLRATTFLLLHEYAHLVFEHVPDAENSVRLGQEKDADNYALDCMAFACIDETDQAATAAAIALLFASNLFIPKSAAGIWSLSIRPCTNAYATVLRI